MKERWCGGGLARVCDLHLRPRAMREIVRLRGGVCYPAGVYRRDREALASELNFGWPSAACTAPALQAIHSPLTLG
jgi:hypothetical protein